jgi:hypothetical protein
MSAANKADNLRKARGEAWKTRREKYGPRGHSSAYSRGPAGACPHCTAAVDLVMRLLNEATLSEGQVSKALRVDRVTVRALADRTRGNQ